MSAIVQFLVSVGKKKVCAVNGQLYYWNKNITKGRPPSGMTPHFTNTTETMIQCRLYLDYLDMLEQNGPNSDWNSVKGFANPNKPLILIAKQPGYEDVEITTSDQNSEESIYVEIFLEPKENVQFNVGFDVSAKMLGCKSKGLLLRLRAVINGGTIPGHSFTFAIATGSSDNKQRNFTIQRNYEAYINRINGVTLKTSKKRKAIEELKNDQKRQRDDDVKMSTYAPSTTRYLDHLFLTSSSPSAQLPRLTREMLDHYGFCQINNQSDGIYYMSTLFNNIMLLFNLAFSDLQYSSFFLGELQKMQTIVQEHKIIFFCLDIQTSTALLVVDKTTNFRFLLFDPLSNVEMLTYAVTMAGFMCNQDFEFVNVTEKVRHQQEIGCDISGTWTLFYMLRLKQQFLVNKQIDTNQILSEASFQVPKMIGHHLSLLMQNQDPKRTDETIKEFLQQNSLSFLSGKETFEEGNDFLDQYLLKLLSPEEKSYKFLPVEFSEKEV